MNASIPFVLILLACLLSGCREPAPAHEGAGTMSDSVNAPIGRPPIADVLARHTSSLLAVSGVVGTGEGRSHDEAVIVVFVVKRTPELERRIPKAIEGYPVELRESGEVTAPPR